MRYRAGQTVTEYAVLLGVVTVAMLGMQVYSRRAIQAAIKKAADQLSPYSSVEDPHGDLAQELGSSYETGKRTDDDLVPNGNPTSTIPGDGYMPGDVLVSASKVHSTSTSGMTTRGFTGGGTLRTVVPGQQRSQTVGTLTTCGSHACAGTGVSSYGEVISDRLYR